MRIPLKIGSRLGQTGFELIDSPVSTSQMLCLQACTTIPGLLRFYMWVTGPWTYPNTVILPPVCFTKTLAIQKGATVGCKLSKGTFFLWLPGCSRPGFLPSSLGINHMGTTGLDKTIKMQNSENWSKKIIFLHKRDSQARYQYTMLITTASREHEPELFWVQEHSGLHNKNPLPLAYKTQERP